MRTSLLSVCTLLFAVSHAAEAPPAEPGRAALLPTEARQQTDQSQGFPDDEVVWLDVDAAKVIGVFRASVQPATRGAFLLILPAGYAADAVLATVTLRHELPRRGYATLAVPLPDAPEADSSKVRARLDAALAALTERAPGVDVFVFGEAQAAAWVVWAQAEGFGAKGAVALNLDLKVPSIGDAQPRAILKGLESPALLLIESPRTWSQDVILAAATELQLLPPGHAGGERLERRLRGWLKRNFATHG